MLFELELLHTAVGKPLCLPQYYRIIVIFQMYKRKDFDKIEKNTKGDLL